MPADLLFDKEASADAIRFGGGLGAGRAIDENECKIYLVKTYTCSHMFNMRYNLD